MTRLATWVTASLLLTVAAVAQAAPPPGYKTCVECHLANGKGVPGSYPPLAGRVASLAATPDGRRYLVAVPSFGLSGKLMVGGTVFRGVMPRQSQLSAAELAAVLNYLATELNAGKGAAGFTPFTAAEVDKLRKTSPAKSPAEVAKLRAVAVAAATNP
jgi:mono/diheme cytochrome c family protein